MKTSLLLLGLSKAASDTICEAEWLGPQPNSQLLSCPGGRIKINDAVWGRGFDTKDICCGKNKKACWIPKSSESTCSMSATELIAAKCDGEAECMLYGNLNGLLGDPCKKKAKYLTVDYECDYSTNDSTISFCEANIEGRTDSFTCPEGKEVFINSASWGREKDNFCCPNKQEGQCQANSCSAPFDATSLLAEKCGGASECSWTKDDFALEDPCAGTFKYMKVDYECRDPPQFVIGNDQGKLFEETSRFVDCADMVNAFSTKIGEVIEQASEGVEHLYKGWHSNRNQIFPRNMLKIAKRLEACLGTCESVASESAVRAALSMNPESMTVADAYANAKSAFEALENFVTKEVCDSDVRKNINHKFVQRKAGHFKHLIFGNNKRRSHLIKNHNWSLF